MIPLRAAMSEREADMSERERAEETEGELGQDIAIFDQDEAVRPAGEGSETSRECETSRASEEGYA